MTTNEWPCARRIAIIALIATAAYLPSKSAAQFGEAYRISGTADVDAAGCAQQGPTGQLVQQFWVLRRYDIVGPTQVTMSGLPANVSVTLTPSILTYPGWVVGQQVTATFTFNGGATIPDSVIKAQVSDGAGNSASADITLHGTCPRHNKDFTIRGSFFSTHQGVTFPVSGALVEIYRDVPYWFDQRVGSTITGTDGVFDVKLSASGTDTYYAKLLLNDNTGVYLHDWWTQDIRDYNSVNRGDNAQPVVDVGGTVIVRDGGSGTPRTAVWQAGHLARREFEQTFSAPAPVDDYEIVIENTISGLNWSLRSKTHWEEGTQVFKFSTGGPTGLSDPSFNPYFSQFLNYGGMIHEFGHALRQTADGDDQHFFDDIVKYGYGREHDLCTTSNTGEAFNEGWADFWALDTGPIWEATCASAAADVSNMENEGAVMNDLHMIAQAIDACQPAIVGRVERVKRERRNMFAVLGLRTQLVHSDADFRGQLQLRFPGCTLPAVGSRGVAPSLVSGISGANLAIKVVPTAQRLGARAAFYKNYATQLSEELVKAERDAHPCGDARCIEARLLKPILLRAQSAYAGLVVRQLELGSAQGREPDDRPSEMSGAGLERAARRLAAFDLETRKIAQDALAQAQRALQGPAARDRTGTLRAQLSELRMASRRLSLKTPDQLEVYAFFKLPTPPDDDQAIAYRR